MNTKEKFNEVDNNEELAKQKALTPSQVKNIFVKYGYPDVPYQITQRLSILDRKGVSEKSHFGDDLEIAEIMAGLWPNLSEKKLDQLAAASLLHDIGKSGPVEARLVEQRAFGVLFNLDFNQSKYDGLTPRDLTFERALQIKVAEGQISESEAFYVMTKIIEASSRQKNKIPETTITKETKMADLWAAHVYWSTDILRFLQVDNDVTSAVSAHHLIDGYGPDLSQAEVISDYEISLMLADKYQAFRRRSRKSHVEAMVILQKMIESKIKDEKLRERHLEILKKFEKIKELIK